MADVITRFKLETTQYDSKLRDAAKGLSEYTKQATMAGNEFGKFTQKNMEVARSFGTIATSATNSKDKVKELVGAYNDVAKAYNALTKDQQSSDFGKALAQSMNTLKGRISEAKTEMNGTSGVLDSLKGKFMINVDALKLLNWGLTAAKKALDVAKDAFFANETNVDNWGRTVASAEGIYDSFLQTLNTGDFSGFLSRIGEVISSSKEAYNALDELNTRMTVINPERTRLQARATELRATIRRSGKDSEAGKAAQQELMQLEGKLTEAFRTESKLNMNAFKAEVDKKLKGAGIKLDKQSYDFLMRSFSSDRDYKRLAQNARGSIDMVYDDEATGLGHQVDNRNMNQKLLDLFTDKWRQQYSPLLNAAFSARGSAASTMLSNARYLNNGGGNTERQKTVEQLNNEKIQALTQEYLNATEERKTAIRSEIKGLQDRNAEIRRMKDEALGKDTAEQLNNEKIQALTQEYIKASEDRRKAIRAEIKDLQDRNAEIQRIKDEATGKWKPVDLKGASPGQGVALGGVDMPQFRDQVVEVLPPIQQLEAELERLAELQAQAWSPEVFADYQRKIDETKEKLDVFKGIKKDSDNSSKSFLSAASAIGAVGNALNSIEDPTAKIMGIIAEAIAGVAAGAGQAISAKDTTSSGWAWIGAAAAITASMVAMIAEIHNATGYAHGGVIEGTSFSGDNQWARVNAGETILNRAQSGVIASALQDSGRDSGYSSAPYVTGETIILGANNHLKRSGQGELVTTSMLKRMGLL